MIKEKLNTILNKEKQIEINLIQAKKEAENIISQAKNRRAKLLKQAEEKANNVIEGLLSRNIHLTKEAEGKIRKEADEHCKRLYLNLEERIANAIRYIIDKVTE